MIHVRNRVGISFTLLMALALPAWAQAPCDEPGTVGGGALGLSPGPVGPPDSLGWDVGSGQCNGSFTITSDPAFPGGALELGLRAEERRVGQVENMGGNYEVETGFDDTPPAAMNRAWWNFQTSVAYDGDIDELDGLCLIVETESGSSVAAGPVDLLDPALRPLIGARNNQPNPTAGFADLYQVSQNPLFGWLSDGMGGPYDFFEEGAWRFTLQALEDGVLQEASICISTPGAPGCGPEPMRVPAFACPLECQSLDFDGTAAGTVIDTQFFGVTISGSTPVMSFDSASPTCDDEDLETPGAGAGNDTARDGVLILSEDFSSCAPDDHRDGGIMTFDFEVPREVDWVGLLDIDEDGTFVRAFDAAGGALGDFPAVVQDDNGWQQVVLGLDGVGSLEVHLAGSGAVTEIACPGMRRRGRIDTPGLDPRRARTHLRDRRGGSRR
ncbi:MAG: hypothetical protein AAF533_06475 [Acidobacteriota bacterium]